MSFKYNWKNINGHMLMLILLAPIVYLFGTQFVALAGAHGEDILNYEEVTEVDYSVSLNGVDYSRYGYTEDFYFEYYYISDGLSFKFLRDSVMAFSNDPLDFWGYGMAGSVTDYDYSCFSTYLDFDSFDSAFSVDEVMGVVNMCSSFWFYSADGNDVLYLEIFVTPNVGTYIYQYLYDVGGSDWYHCPSDSNDYDTQIGWVGFGMDMPLFYSNKPNLLGIDIDLTSMPTHYIPLYQPTITHSVATTDTSYSSALFGRWFGANNILEKMGRNALSSSPMGFAPFGSFLSFIDSNMLHMADSQIGLMAYGYFYYSANVLIFDLAFYCVTFIPRFIRKVVEKLEGGIE